MAWVLGLFFTDGWISGRGVFIASTDVELLEKIGALTTRRFAINEYLQSDRKNKISKLAIHHPEMLADLRALGLEERKSLTMRFPTVPDEFVRHFVRGCWDGDGGFTLTGGKLVAHYTCGSLAFIEKLVAELFKAGIVRRILHIEKGQDRQRVVAALELLRRDYGRDGPFPVRIYKRKNVNAYDVRLAGRAQLSPLFDFLYKDVGEHIYLKRKYDLIAGLS